MFLCCMATTFAQFSGSGSGTESDPYLILNPIQLNQMRNINGHYKLMANLDLTEFIEDEYPKGGWLPIPNFNGVFDGNGKTITGLVIDRDNNVGLFGKCSGTIKNLTLRNVSIKGKDNVGSLVGIASGLTISNCYVDGNIIGVNSVGGFAGSCLYQNSILFENLTGKVKVQATGNYVGGIYGSYKDGYGRFMNCKISDSSVSGIDYVGGLTGINANIINDSSFEGAIDGHSYVGGLAGLGYCNISRSYVYGNIYASGDYIGGIAGYCRGYNNSQNWQTDIRYLNNCQFYGNLYGENYVGGIAGYYSSWNDHAYTGIRSCITNAKISGDDYVGGICGFLSQLETWSAIFFQYNCMVSTQITARGEKLSMKEGDRTTPIVGLIFGEKSGTRIQIKENKSYNRAIIFSKGISIEVEDNEQNGSGVSATTLKLKATYVAMDWDFNDIWEIQETECYPYFKTQTAPPVITSEVVSGATTISGKSVDGGIVTLEIDGEKQQVTCSGNSFLFKVSPLQTGHEVRISAQVEGKEPSYFTTATVAYLGSGKENDPYQVCTTSDLTGVYRKGYYKLMNDIDLTDYINQFSPTEGWQSIGRNGSETIHFNGDGHKITGLWCNSTRDNTGLFSLFADGSIKNLTVEVAKGKQVKGGKNTGIVIGKMINGTIDNCHVSGTLADGAAVGGLVGLLDGGSILRCQSDAIINNKEEKAFVGGLVGDLKGSVDQCLSKGSLTATGKNANIAGLVGVSQAGSSISNSYSTSPISSSYCAAGIVGYNYGTVDKCYAQGNLDSKNYAAGIVGYNDGSEAIVKNCVAMNLKLNVTYESQSAQGGGYGNRIAGGIKNGAPAPEMNNYALKSMKMSLNGVPQKIYDDIMNGIAKTAEELKNKATYQTLGWDFNTIWKIVDGESCPYFEQVEYVPEVPVIIEANSYTREYGEPNPQFGFTVQDGDLSGMPEITCEATVTSPVGTYPIVISKGTLNNNDVTYINGTLTIMKAPLTVSVEDVTREQYVENPEFVITYTGWKVGDEERVLTKKPKATTKATKDSPVGEYEIVVSGGEAKNYELSYQNGTLTVIEPTGISKIAIIHPVDVYTLQGHKVRTMATTLGRLPKGVYIVNGRKVVIK